MKNKNDESIKPDTNDTNDIDKRNESFQDYQNKRIDRSAFIDQFLKDQPDKGILTPIGIILADYINAFKEQKNSEISGINKQLIQYPPHLMKYGERILGSLDICQ